MTVYFIRGEGLIKIGFSKNVETRVQCVISQTPFTCELMGYMPGGREVEKHLHKKFKAHRKFGEWFEETPELLNLINSVAINSAPADDPQNPFDRLEEMDANAVDKSVLAIREFMSELGVQQADLKHLSLVAKALGLSIGRLSQIWNGEAHTVSYGEYMVLQFALERAPHTRADAQQIEPNRKERDE